MNSLSVSSILNRQEVQIIVFLIICIFIILHFTSRTRQNFTNQYTSSLPSPTASENSEIYPQNTTDSNNDIHSSPTTPKGPACDIGCTPHAEEPRYYKKLSEMSPAQIVKFKNKAKPEKMTMADYKAWLSLYEFDMGSLPRHHHENLDRLLKGLPILDIPRTPTMIDEILSGHADEMGSTTITLQIPNTEVDSPVNYNPRTTLDTAGEIDVRNRSTPHSLQFGGYAGYADYRNANKNKVERSKNLKADQWFQRGSFPWIFDQPESGYLFKENRFENIIKNEKEGRQACCAERQLNEIREEFQPTRPKFFDYIKSTEERILGPRPRKLPEGLYTYPAKVTGLGQGASYQGAIVDPNRLVDKTSQVTHSVNDDIGPPGRISRGLQSGTIRGSQTPRF